MVPLIKLDVVVMKKAMISGGMSGEILLIQNLRGYTRHRRLKLVLLCSCATRIKLVGVSDVQGGNKVVIVDEFVDLGMLVCGH